MDPDKYCQEKAAASGSSFYYSFLFLNPIQKQAMVALYAFCREVDDIVDECTEESIARTKLQWWREEISRLFTKEPRHPVSKALLSSLGNFDLAEEYFQEIIDGMEMDLDYEAYPSFKELGLYCHRVAGVVGLLSAEIFGYQDRKTLDYARDLGFAFQLTNILRDVREDADRGRLYIPLDELKQHNVSAEDIFAHKNSDAMQALFKTQAKRAADYYEKAHSLLPEVDRYPQRCGLIMSAIYETTLREVEADGFRVLNHRTSLTPLRKLWVAWKTARKEHKIEKKRQRLLKNRE
ncbi:MAG: squalene synthase HpnD [Gammaproteobacteria bacterium]|nr:presqualene diphosphate synthase HpnD [Gammaproteobacteria bacterium]PCH63337.1 MAG: squalene synthase HpnD [Gammaproteobacteria bacterium]